MGTSYPDRTNATGVWKLSDITRNKLTQGTYPKGAGRGFNAGDNNSPNVQINTISIKTTGDATDFGDLSQSPGGSVWSVHGSDTRCIFGGAYPAATIIQYIVPTSQGNSADFGDLSVSRGYIGGGSNRTRSVNYAGQTPDKGNVIDFMQIQTLGNATDFGDATQQGRQPAGNCNRRRAFLAGGDDGPSPASGTNRIEFVEISTTGNGIDFGDLHATVVSCPQGVGSSTRALQGGGGPSGGLLTRINSFQYDSLGDATDFGDLTVARRLMGAVSDGQRGVWMGGAGSPADVNTIDFVEIASSGNATDFGDCTQAQQAPQSGGDAHQGLDEFFPRAPELYSPTGRPLRHDALVGVGDLALFNVGKIMETTSISSTGNTVNFGTADLNGLNGGFHASSTRCVMHLGKYNQSWVEYVEFKTKGNTADFGDVTQNRQNVGGSSNNIRGIIAGGETPSGTNVMDYCTIATIGNYSDFGDLTESKGNTSSICNTTRYVRIGGYASPGYSNVLDYVTIANTGNATDFGDLVATNALAADGAGGSSQTRGIIAGGYADSAANVIQYITFSSTGNTTDFGDTTSNRQSWGAAGNGTRGIYAGGTGGSNVSDIDFITIASTANAADFGDLSTAAQSVNGASNCHGALS